MSLLLSALAPSLSCLLGLFKQCLDIACRICIEAWLQMVKRVSMSGFCVSSGSVSQGFCVSRGLFFVYGFFFVENLQNAKVTLLRG